MWEINGKVLVKRYKVSVVREISSRVVMYSVVTVINNILFTRNLLT